MQELREKNNIAFSVIIPHKNIPDLLIRCVNSIPKRDDLEIIIIDDNSSGDIVNFENFPFKNDDSRNLKIIFDKSDLGAGHARNLGLEVAQGKFLIFADADDFFLFTLNNILDKYKNSDYDLIFCNACSLDCEFYTNADRAKYVQEDISMYRNSPQKAEFYLKYSCSVVWSKIIKRDLAIKNLIRFDELPCGNDIKFSYLTGFYAKSWDVCEIAIYCVTERKDSLTRTETQDRKIVRLNILVEKIKFFVAHNIECDKFSPIYSFYKYYKNSNNDKNFYNEGMNILKSLNYTEKEIKLHLCVACFQRLKSKLKYLIKKII